MSVRLCECDNQIDMRIDGNKTEDGNNHDDESDTEDELLFFI